MIYKVYFAGAGVSKTALTPLWSSLKKTSDGTDYTPQPAISEIGGGFYKFDISPAEDLVGVIDGGASLADIDRYVSVDLSPNDSGAGGSSSIILPVMQGSVYTAAATQNKTVKIVRGDTPKIYFDFGADYTGYEAWFGAKANLTDAAYYIEPKLCIWIDVAKGQGSVELTSAETAAVGRYEAEIELRSGGQILTAMKFRLVIIDDVIK